MKVLMLKPIGWPCQFSECPPGLFVQGASVALKTEYGTTEAYCDSGERFWGGTDKEKDILLKMVTPVEAKWEDIEYPDKPFELVKG